MKKIIISLALFLLLPIATHAVPAVSGVSGTVNDGGSVIVNGAGFGANGPTITFFDNFEGGTVGQNIRTGADSATIGQWQSLNTVPPKYSSDTAVSGTKAFKVTSVAGIEGQTNGVIALPNSTETFISWWCYVPTSSPWSGEGTQINWKIMWLMQNNSVDNDMSYAMLLDQNTRVEGGNNTPIVYPDTEPWSSTSMIKGRWQRYWWWIKDGYANDGQIKIWEMTPTGPSLVKTVANKTTLFPSAVRKMLSVNGYTRLMTTTQATQMFDDVYVSTGPNSRARVEIGTGCTGGSYASCTNLAISTANSWSDGSINITMRGGNLSSGSAYLFVTDANGVTSVGYPITIGGTVTPCIESWRLTNTSIWSTCANNSQSRTLTYVDDSNCGTTNNKPTTIETQSCSTTYNLSNFTQLVTDWLKNISSPADINSDGKVNSQDLGIMMSNWN